MAISIRARFEVFKRDEFTCKYCGRRSPEVILECDHIVPVCDGGSDDPINLVTSCWDCNRGKGGIGLAAVMTGEDPHDRAIELLERKRQLAEYNRVLEAESAERDATIWELWRYWQTERGRTSKKELESLPKRDYTWLFNTLSYCPRVKLTEFFDAAAAAGATRDFRYVSACLRNWREAKPAISEAPPTLPAASSSEPDAVVLFEELIAEVQSIAGISRPDAITTVVDLNVDLKAYERDEVVKDVLRTLSAVEYWRRHIGYCPHPEPTCPGFFLCVMRETSLRLDVGTLGGPP